MASYSSIPVPLTAEDEEEQLEYAILRSLGHFDDPIESLRRDSASENDTPLHSERSVETMTTKLTAAMPISSLYCRSKTEPNILEQSGHSNGPTLISNSGRARSLDHSSPWKTFSTDCCEVRDEIYSGNNEYLDQLKKGLQTNVVPPIHIAVNRGHFDCLDAIIGAFPDILNSKDTKGETSLFLAISDGNVRMARRLLDAGVDVNVTKQNRDTPLLAAVENDSHTLTHLLLGRGANPNVGMNRGWTAMHECVYRGNADLLDLLLSNGGDPNIRDMFGVSPVFSSAACGRNECLQLLLRAGGDPNLCALSKVASPLYEACKESQVACAMTLLKHGADPHIPNCENLFPIHMACQKGLIRVVEELVKVTNKNLVQYCGKSPIHCAAEEDEIQVLEILISNGYDVNVKIEKDKISFRDRRQTALFYAVYNDSEEATKVLLDAGANPDMDYVKPLLVGESHRQYEIVDMLISSGANINASFADEGLAFPATIAFAMKDAKMLQKILLAGCDVNKCFSCPFGEDDHGNFSEDEQKKSFCHFIGQEQNIGWAGWTVLHLFDFVTNVTLCRRLIAILQQTAEWDDILKNTGQPRTLTHLCRMRIRATTNAIIFDRTNLHLPKPLLNYLNHEPFQ